MLKYVSQKRIVGIFAVKSSARKPWKLIIGPFIVLPVVICKKGSPRERAPHIRNINIQAEFYLMYCRFAYMALRMAGLMVSVHISTMSTSVGNGIFSIWVVFRASSVRAPSSPMDLAET